MAGLLSLLGRRSPSTQPLAARSASGAPPDLPDLPEPPPAKAARTAEPDAGSKPEPTASDILAAISRLQVTVEAQGASQQQLVKEFQALEARQGRLEDKVLKMERGKGPVSADPGVQRQQERLSADLVDLQRQVERQEQQHRALNVMMYDIPEVPEQTPVQQVSDCLQAAGVAEVKINSAVRLGRPAAPTASSQGPSRIKPRPVKVTLQSSEGVISVFRASRQLRETQRISVDRDLTPAQRDARKARQPAAQKLRERGYNTFWRGENLFFIDRGTGKREAFNGQFPQPWNRA